ncbi:hypothetical protein [Rhizobium ruizarguesonis]|uniref:hypothetical protein n=1 Tax=Rhizobium ruizarguesonis TaxID=2081791 RepID=UPI0013C269CC|nr:hypothetical protein [Rhizobium ruizarguesonis]NEH32634.1 hypothetical protein [Rhizobium ruizarguesonis]NEK07454.1 hypothetical protein [Rhizobium ruizarguesonis]
MAFIGNFNPTVSELEMMVKGYTLDENGDGGKTYLSAVDLKKLGNACLYVAFWLETRRSLSQQKQEG